MEPIRIVQTAKTANLALATSRAPLVQLSKAEGRGPDPKWKPPAAGKIAAAFKDAFKVIIDDIVANSDDRWQVDDFGVIETPKGMFAHIRWTETPDNIPEFSRHICFPIKQLRSDILSIPTFKQLDAGVDINSLVNF